ncbi:SURF1 family protein [Ideonella sp. BN130291]|uniref:SURF1 family protein n=1 Tax=Ideonella sp. BN130291 TaxID=3112940 RepID=UPI002E266E04|nr:SURF1 family protein [Ideonella sp. BN130291]
MHGQARRPRSTPAFAALLGAAAFALAGFLALGVWQVQRLAWKQDLITRVERQVHAAPVPAPGPADWPTLSRNADEYRRVRLQGRFDHERETLVRASTALGLGYWVLTPLHTEQGIWVLVNRGFVPSATEPRGRPCPASSSDSAACTAHVTGLLRLSEAGGSLLQHNDPAQGRWYSRDVQAIAAVRGLAGSPVAPYFVDAEAGTAPAAGWPRAGLTVLRFSNNHAVYAATWFALAAMVAGAMAYLVIDERRLRRLAGDPPRAHVRR